MTELSNYEPLFLKYRPQTLEELVGQESVKDTLKNAIENNKLVHAYLFTGPRGSGKTSSARILAKSLNCEEGPTPSPCGKCASCTSIANASSLDVVEIDAASHGHVEDARQLIEKVNLASISGKYKIYIIDEVHMLSTAAFNALLKVFEEPPEKVVFILATTEEDKVLNTIVSRCQKFNFKHISLADQVKRLKFVSDSESISIDGDALELIAKRSDGGMRDALGMLDQLSVFEAKIDKNKVLDLLGGLKQDDLQALTDAMTDRKVADLLSKLDEIFAQGKEATMICREFNAYLIELLESGNHKFENFELVQIIEKLADLEFRMRQTTQSKNLLRASLLMLAHREDMLLVKELAKRVEELEAGGVVAKPATKAASKPQPVSARPKPEPVAAAVTPIKEERAPEASAPVEAPKPVMQAPEPPPVASSAEAFYDYLSPACKGICISSNATVKSIDAGQVTVLIPKRFKFLKAKLEAKSEEIIEAIAKSSGETVTSLLVDETQEELAAAPK